MDVLEPVAPVTVVPSPAVLVVVDECVARQRRLRLVGWVR
eukprot:COSAG02_NODE_44_length_45948_cov_81.673493_28_plen_40_part_00